MYEFFLYSSHTHDKGSQNITGHFRLGSRIIKYNSVSDTVVDVGGVFSRHSVEASSLERYWFYTDSTEIRTTVTENPELRKIDFNANNEGAWTVISNKYIKKY